LSEVSEESAFEEEDEEYFGDSQKLQKEDVKAI
jgi:hypothetical protein